MGLMDWFFRLLQSVGLSKVTSIWVYVTLGGAGVAALCFWNPLWRLRRQIKAFLDHTKDLAPRSPANAEALDQYFASDQGNLATCWASYRQARNDPLLQWTDSRYPDVTGFFPATFLIERMGRRRLAEAIPGMLTAFGILGTFVGLSVGLRGLAVADVEHIRTSINTLLGGMNVAFHTSVAAISCSIVWLGADRSFLGKAMAEVDQLHDRLLRLLPAPAEPELLQQMLQAQQEHASTIKTFLSDSLLPKLVEGFSTAVQETLVPELEKSTKSLAETLPGIASVFREAVETSLAPHVRATAAAVEEFARAGTAKQVEGVQQMATEFLHALDGKVRDQFDNLALLVRELMDASTKLTADASVFAQRMEEFAILNESVGGKVGDMLSVLGAYTEEFRHFHGSLESAMRGMREAAEQAQGFHVQLSEHLASMAGIQTSLNDTWSRLSTDMQPRVIQLAKVWEETHEKLATLNGSLEHSAEAFASNLHAGLTRTFESFDDNLARATAHLAGSLGQMNETVEQISGQLGQFRRLVTDISGALTGLQKSVVEMSGGLTQFERTVAQAIAVVGLREEGTR
ncbi:MAG: hypothetical protein QME70_04185 [Bacillota bacterium]|nr:hypothetical protein [Bacillota bacterium]